ncbi:GNAT family N-acetyltransferase [Paenibacillus sp. BC26]|uniref:GNAT family N-acetyltransferase n=1 Tax=Paenibacillus sp. BC26 TaxID=1881032 RepID=UPI0008E15BD2|nr:GNAT family N-acetyltransferase [Paenibacillus sp. BC26]SFS69521.1 Protein N-acetyltransferase, RimJ/RimL family [Paenibacillus sp. BC26]
MKSYMWEGSKVRLRPLEFGDWEDYHQNDHDSEGARLCDMIHFPRTEEGTKAWAEEKVDHPVEGDNIWLSIETLDGVLVGSLCTSHCDPRNGTFKYGIAIFREHWRQGYASEAIKLILGYYFEELRYAKANAHVYAFNNGSIALQEHLGFKQEGRLRDMIFTKGKHHDEFIYGLTKREYEELLQEKSTMD